MWFLKNWRRKKHISSHQSLPEHSVCCSLALCIFLKTNKLLQAQTLFFFCLCTYFYGQSCGDLIMWYNYVTSCLNTFSVQSERHFCNDEKIILRTYDWNLWKRESKWSWIPVDRCRPEKRKHLLNICFSSKHVFYYQYSLSYSFVLQCFYTSVIFMQWWLVYIFRRTIVKYWNNHV